MLFNIAESCLSLWSPSQLGTENWKVSHASDWVDSLLLQVHPSLTSRVNDQGALSQHEAIIRIVTMLHARQNRTLNSVNITRRQNLTMSTLEIVLHGCYERCIIYAYCGPLSTVAPASINIKTRAAEGFIFSESTPSEPFDSERVRKGGGVLFLTIIPP